MFALSKEQILEILKWRTWNVSKFALILFGLVLIYHIVSGIVEADTARVVATWDFWDGLIVDLSKWGVGVLTAVVGAVLDKLARANEKEALKG